MKGWRTLIFGVGTAVFGVLTTFEWQTVVTNPQTLGLITTGIGIGTAVLRFFTSTPVGRSE